MDPRPIYHICYKVRRNGTVHVEGVNKYSPTNHPKRWRRSYSTHLRDSNVEMWLSDGFKDQFTAYVRANTQPEAIEIITAHEQARRISAT